MRISKKLSALGAFFVLALCVAGCGSSIPGNSVASVAGNPITLQAFDHWEYVAAKGQAAQAQEEGESEPVIVPNDPPNFAGCIKQIKEQIPTLAKTSAKTLRSECSSVFSQYKTEVMGYLIESYWYQAYAHKLGITYSQAALNKVIAGYKKDAGSTAAFNAELKEGGETLQDIEFQARVEGLYEKLIKHFQTPVTAAAISAYYNAHKSTYGSKEYADLHLVRTTSQSKAQAAYNALKSGQSWTTVAKTYSASSSGKANGGLITNVVSGEEEAAVNKAIFSSKVGQIVGPIHGQFGYYVIELTKLVPATQESLAKATPTIKSTLTTNAQDAAETKVNDGAKKLWGSETLCRSTYSVSDCAGYVAPKTTTSSTTTPAATTSTPSTTSTSATSTSTTKSSG